MLKSGFVGITKTARKKITGIGVGLILAGASLGLGLPVVLSQTANAATLDVCASGCTYTTIQAAVDAASAGDTVTVGAGTYSEAVSVTKSINIVGAGTSSTKIQTPSTLPSEGSVINISGSGTNVDIKKLTVEGPGPSSCGSVMAGVFVENDAYANLHNMAVNDIQDSPLSGCQNGRAILVGWGHGSTIPNTTGTADINNVTINGYQKAGIEVSGSGSDANVRNNTVTGDGPTSAIASNGIEVTFGAAATVKNNVVSGNEYTVASDFATGILLYQPATSTVVKSNTVSGNEIGLWTDSQNSIAKIDTTGITGNTRQAVADTTGWSAPSTTYADVGLSGTTDSNGSDIVTTQGQLAVYGYNAFNAIQSAINASSNGKTVNIAAGTYAENVDVNKDVTLAGAGNNASGTVIQPASGNGITVDASGTSSAAPLTIENIQVTGAAYGVYFNSSVSHVALNNVAAVNNNNYGIEIHNSAVVNDLVLTNVTATGNQIGLRVATTGSVNGLAITGSHFDNNSAEGAYITASSGSTTNQNDFTNITITDSSFSNDTNKGFYAEKIDNATFNGVTIDNSGYSDSFGSGLNINEKYGTYQNITIENSSITNSGTGDATNGTGINIEARDDAPSYSSNPATLNNVTISGSTITGNQVGLRFGETGKDNAGPTNVVLLGNNLSGNINSPLNNQSLASIDASKNWWGSTSTPASSIVGTATYVPWCAQSTCTSYISDEVITLPVSGNQATTSDDLTLTGAVSSGAATATIPSGTITTASGGTWNGSLNPPVTQVVTIPGTPGYTTTAGIGIEVGSNNLTLSFSNAVRVLLPGQAGTHVGFSEPGGSLTEITTLCNGDTLAEANAQLLPGGGQCYVTVGPDLVVWTTHFSSFATYTLTPISSGGGSSSGGNSTHTTAYIYRSSTSTPGGQGGQLASADNNSGEETDANINTPDEGGNVSVKGASIGKNNKQNTQSSSAFLGLGWWWLAVLAATLVVVWYVFVHRRSQDTSGSA